MIKKLTTICLVFLCLSSWNSVTAQNCLTQLPSITGNQAPVNTITQYTLPTYGQVDPDCIDDLVDAGSRTIFYGKTPPNSSGNPVLLFVHGNNDEASAWFHGGGTNKLPKNDMYELAYNANYRTAYISTTKSEGMFNNGKILATMLEAVTNHYGVNEVVIIAHSNGGKDSEIAMVLENKKHLVNKVIALGTPFRGTYLANFVYWTPFIGNAGNTTSTTFYMDYIARPMIDMNANNEPEKFFVFGAWGFGNGSSTSRPFLTLSGQFLNQRGSGSTSGGPKGGGNDGTSPYYSTRRPGATMGWPGCYSWFSWSCHKPSRLDHADLAYGQLVWSSIQPYFNQTVNKSSAVADVLIKQTEQSPTLRSSHEIVSTKDGFNNQFTVTENQESVQLSLIHHDEADFQIVDMNDNNLVAEMKGNYSKSSNTFLTEAKLGKLNPGTYTIHSDSDEFFALIDYPEGPSLTFKKTQNVITQPSLTELSVEIEGTDEHVDLTAIATVQSDFLGNSLKETPSYILEFTENEDGQYTCQMPDGLVNGVYSLMINANGTTFRRNLLTGFAINSERRQIPYALDSFQASVFPNPATDRAVIGFELTKEMSSDVSINLYDMYGRILQSFLHADLSKGKHQLEIDLRNLNSGSYFVKISTGEQTITKTVIKSN